MTLARLVNGSNGLYWALAASSGSEPGISEVSWLATLSM